LFQLERLVVLLSALAHPPNLRPVCVLADARLGAGRHAIMIEGFCDDEAGRYKGDVIGRDR
jgi:hypothetical protein